MNKILKKSKLGDSDNIDCVIIGNRKLEITQYYRSMGDGGSHNKCDYNIDLGLFLVNILNITKESRSMGEGEFTQEELWRRGGVRSTTKIALGLVWGAVGKNNPDRWEGGFCSRGRGDQWEGGIMF